MMHSVFSTQQLEWIRKNLNIAVIHCGDKQRVDSFIFKNLSPRSTKTYAPAAKHH